MPDGSIVSFSDEDIKTCKEAIFSWLNSLSPDELSKTFKLFGYIHATNWSQDNMLGAAAMFGYLKQPGVNGYGDTAFNF